MLPLVEDYPSCIPSEQGSLPSYKTLGHQTESMCPSVTATALGTAQSWPLSPAAFHLHPGRKGKVAGDDSESSRPESRPAFPVSTENLVSKPCFEPQR